MPVAATNVLFVVQSVLRLGTAARRAYQDGVIDEAIVIPEVDVALLTSRERALDVIDGAIRDEVLVLAEWEADYERVRRKDASAAGLAAQRRLLDRAAELDVAFRLETDREALNVLAQWSSDANRQSFYGRVGIELADIALDYVGANPALFGAQGNGAKLITGIATDLSELLPDPDDPNPATGSFAEGALRVFVEGGLRALDARIGVRVDEAHLRDFARATLAPIIEAVDRGDQDGQRWFDLRDEFLGPVAEAAIGALARNQAAFLGEDFAPGTRAGELARSVLLAVKDDGIADDLGVEGLTRAWGAMLDAVLSRPELFLGSGEHDGDVLTRRVLVGAVTTLRSSSPPFDRELASSLLASTFDVLGANAALIVGDVDAGDWSTALAEVGGVLVEEVAAGLADGVRRGDDPRILQRLFDREQADELLRIVLTEVTANPGMIVGGAAPEVRTLVTIVGEAMGRQQSLLMSGREWLQVVEDVARVVAANPGRLISVDGLVPAEEQLLHRLLRALLTAAADAAALGRAGGSVLFGRTLAEALRTAVAAAAGNATRALRNAEQVGKLAAALDAFAREHSGEIGRDEWELLFRTYVAAVIDTGRLPSLDPEDLLANLTERE